MGILQYIREISNIPLSKWDPFGVDDRHSDSRATDLELTEYELACVLVERVRSNTSIDWTIKESVVQAKLRAIVKRTLRRYGYPPDLQLLATENVPKQAELLANEWREYLRAA